MNAKKLILFTDSYPFGWAETFLEAEVRHLCRVFDEVTVVPLRYGGTTAKRPLPEGVKVAGPILGDGGPARLLRQGLLNRAPLLPMLRELAERGVAVRPRHVRKWIEATCTARALLSSGMFRNLLRSADEGTVLYFYWACGAAWALPFFSAPGPVVSRFHGFDIYEEREDFDGYIPFRRPFLRRLDRAVCVSDHGRRYLSQKYPECRNRLRVYPLGVVDAGESRPARNGTMQILSCARMVALKRLDVIVDALGLLDFPVEWTHFGDGPTRGAVEKRASSLPPRVRCRFPGRLANRELRRWYREHRCDVFVNVSETEGAPVAVMEALSAGIPVVATAAGGTPELVDEKVGILLPARVSPPELAAALRALHGDEDRRLACARNARERWRRKFDAARNFSAFADFLGGELFAGDRQLTESPGDTTLRRETGKDRIH